MMKCCFVARTGHTHEPHSANDGRPGVGQAVCEKHELCRCARKRVGEKSTRAQATTTCHLCALLSGAARRGTKGGREGGQRDEVYVRAGAIETLLRWSILGEKHQLFRRVQGQQQASEHESARARERESTRAREQESKRAQEHERKRGREEESKHTGEHERTRAREHKNTLGRAQTPTWANAEELQHELALRPRIRAAAQTRPKRGLNAA